MPAFTVKNIPDDLYKLLKKSAQAHRRSLNSEIIYCIERELAPQKVDVSEQLAAARKLRKKTAEYELTDEFLEFAKHEGST